MSKRADNKNVSLDTEIKKKRTDSTPGGSSVDTESQDASPGGSSVDTESQDASPGGSSVDTESQDASPGGSSVDTESQDASPGGSSVDTESQDASPGGSSVDTESQDASPGGSSVDTESQDASAGAMLGVTSVDTERTDTLTLARLDRENQGTWEAEYSYGGEADLHRHYASCTKNPGHENFIPVDKFSIEDLPEGYRDKDVMDYIRAESDLTVRVTVKYVSDRRPETNVVSGKPFPGYSYRGQWRTAVGTASVVSVKVYPKDWRITCRCKVCLTSSKPKTEFGRIYIRTAGHVVYDESEAAHTTCHLYFDRGGSPETCEGVVALPGMSHHLQWQEKDEYWVSHDTHNLELAHRLHQRCEQRLDLRHTFLMKPRYIWNFKWSRTALDKQPLLFLVSHPHGCSKKISIGRCHSVVSLNDKLCGYTYTAATCPGSSGAGIHVLNEGAHDFHLIYMTSSVPLHHGVCDKQPGMNLSLFYKGWSIPEMVSQDLLGGDEEEPLQTICYGEEGDLRKHYDTCQHNPGHQNFFPVDKFSVSHLPPCECKDEIMKLIKVLSDLTVRVSVRYVSEERQKTDSLTDIPYLEYIHRASNQLRIGSGRITDVLFQGNRVCGCEECRNSVTPGEREIALIYIDTASHLVYDKLEAEHTTCHLFFDSGETPDTCKCVLTLTKACGRESYIHEDKYRLVYYTHDLALAHKLKESARLYRDLKRRCDRSYHQEIFKENDRNNLTPNSSLNIVVSHPHGRAKHVSISYPGCHGNTDTEEIQSRFKSITCPGSVGAPFIVLGPQTLYPWLE